jgi:hypothetical protein
LDRAVLRASKVFKVYREFPENPALQVPWESRVPRGQQVQSVRLEPKALKEFRDPLVPPGLLD